MIESAQVPEAIRKALPEFAGIVDAYLADLAHVPAPQLLAGSMFLAFADIPPGPERVQLALRMGEFVDRMLRDGAEEVHDGFVAELIEPLLQPEKAEKYADLEAGFGPAARQALANKREWWRRYIAIAMAVKQLSKRYANVFGPVGLGNDSTRTRIVADRAIWENMSPETRENIYQEMRSAWEKIGGVAGTLEITGPKSEGFPVLRSPSSDSG